MTKLLMREDFEPHIGKQFRFVGAEFSLPLDRIEGSGEQPPGYARPPFVLIFRGPKPGPVLPGGIYDVEVETGETFWIHVSPIQTMAADRQEYQSVMA
ncbi:hypothetical protein QO010_001310 [Caulobacter ginsengisoli]|uniref:DUF6916 domain-containing protein n=1 Tax=Caulobacter ginsengisoli TaxID=400775 RepID=A0ABU0ING7_9CAUL|nr:hypothetical protein [Caulobacter ginsengisoli]MDQ0463539.1 hypothetical protein [Caulobacter ginsengisoli]